MTFNVIVVHNMFVFQLDPRFKGMYCIMEYVVTRSLVPCWTHLKVMQKCERSWDLEALPTFGTKGGERGVLEVPGLD
jgi:hypothetical protein